MEPSITAELQHDLYRVLRKARKEESYLRLDIIAETLMETLDDAECSILADLLYAYEA